MDSTDIIRIIGTFPMILYTSIMIISTFLENPQIAPSNTPTTILMAAQIKAREMEICAPFQTASR